MIRISGALTGLLLATAALAQPVMQSGNVTPGHAPRWVTSGAIGDGGSAAQGLLTEIGTTHNGSAAICNNSGAISGAYNSICIGSTPTGATISVTNHGGATGGFSLVVNGAAQGFATVTLPVIALHGTCFANTSGQLQDCGYVPVAGVANPTATVGLVAVNGSANTALRSDGAPPLSSAVQTALTGTSHGVLVGTGAFGFTATAVGATGTVLVGNSGGNPTFATFLANPTGAGIGLTTLNGSATTAMRSDAAQPLSAAVQVALTGTNHGVSIGTGAFGFGSTAVGATGTVLIGNTGADPTFANFASTFLANPTGAGVGLTTLNGSATTAMRSDAAQPLSATVQTALTGTNHGVALGTGAFGFSATAAGASGTVLIGTGSDPVFTATPSLTAIFVPTVNGGTLAASTLTLQSTSGAGTTDATIFKTGSQVEALRIDTKGRLLSPNGTTTAVIPTAGAAQNPLAVPFIGIYPMDSKLAISNYWINNSAGDPYVYNQVSSYVVAQGNVWGIPVLGTGIAATGGGVGTGSFAWGLAGVAAAYDTAAHAFGAELNAFAGSASGPAGNYSDVWGLSIDVQGAVAGAYPTGYIYMVGNDTLGSPQNMVVLRDETTNPVKTTGNVLVTGFTAGFTGSKHFSAANGINFLNTAFSGYPFVYGTGSTPLFSVNNAGVVAVSDSLSITGAGNASQILTAGTGFRVLNQLVVTATVTAFWGMESTAGTTFTNSLANALFFLQSGGNPVQFAANGAAVMTVQTGVSVGTTTDPGAGKISANVGFVAAGSAGTSATKTVRASGGSADCTLIFTGGILTGGSC